MKDYLSHKNIQQSWDTIAESFDKTRQKPWQACLDFISTLPENGIVADFGCGNGRHTIEIAKTCQQAIGIDISFNLLQIANQKSGSYKNIDCIQANLISVPFCDNTFDAILYIASLHNIPKKNNRKQSLLEAYRVLKPNGRMLLSVWNPNNTHIDNIYDNIQCMEFNKENLEPGDVFIFWTQDSLHIPRYYHLYNMIELREEIIACGFQIESFKRIQISSRKQPDNFFLTLRKQE